MTNIPHESLPLARELKTYPSIERWLRDKEPKTRQNYLGYMIQFSQKSELTPDQFLEWAKSVDPVEVQDRISKMADGLKPAAKFNFQIEMRSFLRHSGYNSLPKSKISYTLQDWHRGYKKEEIRKLLGFLDSLPHKLYVYAALESGFRIRTVLSIRYKHIKEDLEAGVIPVAIRLGPEFYGKKKSAGFSFLGERSVQLIREGIKNGIIKTKDESPLIPIEYAAVYDAVVRAKEKAGLDPKIQPNHGLRKYFEDALDSARLDKDKKMMIEGHFAGTRAKHYTSRDWDELRKTYLSAYPYIDVEGSNPELETKLGNWQIEKLELEKRLVEKDKQIQQLQAVVGVKKEEPLVLHAGVVPLTDDVRELKKAVKKLFEMVRKGKG
jgi:hypothetical protein